MPDCLELKVVNDRGEARPKAENWLIPKFGEFLNHHAANVNAVRQDFVSCNWSALAALMSKERMISVHVQRPVMEKPAA